MPRCPAPALSSPASHQESQEGKETLLVAGGNLSFFYKFNFYFVLEYSWFLLASAGDVKDVGMIPGSGRSPGDRNGYHSSILAWRIPMDWGVWWATVHGLTKRRTRLSNWARTQIPRDCWENSWQYASLDDPQYAGRQQKKRLWALQRKKNTGKSL